MSTNEYTETDRLLIAEIRADISKLFELKKDIASVHTEIALLNQSIRGNGAKGLCERIAEQEKKTIFIEKCHNKLNNKFYMLVSFLLGTGVLGGSFYGAIKFLG